MANQKECFRLEQRSANKSLMAKKCKPNKIYTTMCDIYEEACLVKRYVFKCVKSRLAITSLSQRVDGVDNLLTL